MSGWSGHLRECLDRRQRNTRFVPFLNRLGLSHPMAVGNAYHHHCDLRAIPARGISRSLDAAEAYWSITAGTAPSLNVVHVSVTMFGTNISQLTRVKGSTRKLLSTDALSNFTLWLEILSETCMLASSVGFHNVQRLSVVLIRDRH